ncbi:MAG: cation diffusion facilitator family transporter [Hyphomicrobiales bacterium]|nr:cation diffusion facilitator family transporter [Hyphomicrobiales bacterium]
MPKTLSSKTIVWVELIADVLVAIVKLVAAIFTGSAAMAAEGVHSVVDVGSGGLMLYGYRRARLGPTKRHPLGHGRELYFWSFVVALLFFTLGAGYSIFEGVRHILSPADISSPLVIYLVLAAEALFDGVSFVVALRAFNAAKGDLGYWEAMTRSKDAPSFIVLAEDAAGLVGIAVAAGGTLFATSFNLPVADGVASVVVGLVLAFVGWVLVRESKGLLIGEQASSALTQSILALAESQEGVEGANGVLATHLAPDQIVVTLSLEFSDALRTPEIEEAVRSLEARIRGKHPEVIALFVKPQSHSGFKEAAHARGRNIAFTKAAKEPD